MKKNNQLGGFEFRALQVFIATAEQGGMTAGAEILGITQSGVSQTISSLEEAIGRKLFDRSVRPVVLTSAGQVLYHHGKAILRDVQQAYMESAEVDRSELASLSIAMPESLANVIGPRLYRRRKDLARSWRISNGLLPEQRSKFASHAADMMMTEESSVSDIIDVERHLILTEPYVLIFPKDFALETELGQHLDQSQFIRFSQRSSVGRQTEAQLSRLQLNFPAEIEFDSVIGHARAVSYGLGWGITSPLCLFQNLEVIDDLIVKPISRGSFGRRMTLIARRGMMGTAPRVVADECRLILEEEVFPILIEKLPWLQETLRTGEE